MESYPGVRAPAATPLKVGLSQLLKLKAGETRIFDFSPTRTRTYNIGTFGTSDTVLVLFEVTPTGNVQIAGADDSGTDLNAKVHDAAAERAASTRWACASTTPTRPRDLADGLVKPRRSRSPTIVG